MDIFNASFWSYFNAIGLIGLGYFIFYTYKGLKAKIESLEYLKNVQKDVLGSINEKADAYDELSKKYKQAFDDFGQINEEMIKNYKNRIAALEKELSDKDRKYTDAVADRVSDGASMLLREQSMIFELFEEFLIAIRKSAEQAAADNSTKGVQLHDQWFSNMTFKQFIKKN